MSASQRAPSAEPAVDRLPPMVSYAQNFEDVVLRRAFFGQDRGFYIDVGAADPSGDSVTLWFYEQGWSGINIDPVGEFHARLAAQRPNDINLCAGVGGRRESRCFYEMSNPWLSTFSEEAMIDAGRRGYTAVERVVEVRTLHDICEEFRPERIDFLKIDAEGWEGDILAGANWHRHRPRVVLVEATKPNTPEENHAAWEPQLLGTGYLFAWFDGLNRFYVAEEAADLATRIARPPSFFDNFTLAREQVAEAQIAVLKAEIAARQAHERALEAELQSLRAKIERRRRPWRRLFRS